MFIFFTNLGNEDDYNGFAGVYDITIVKIDTYLKFSTAVKKLACFFTDKPQKLSFLSLNLYT